MTGRSFGQTNPLHTEFVGVSLVWGGRVSGTKILVWRGASPSNCTQTEAFDAPPGCTLGQAAAIVATKLVMEERT